LPQPTSRTTSVGRGRARLRTSASRLWSSRCAWPCCSGEPVAAHRSKKDRMCAVLSEGAVTTPRNGDRAGRRCESGGGASVAVSRSAVPIQGADLDTSLAGTFAERTGMMASVTAASWPPETPSGVKPDNPILPREFRCCRQEGRARNALFTLRRLNGLDAGRCVTIPEAVCARGFSCRLRRQQATPALVKQPGWRGFPL
jgi:hypothetical protein